MSISFDKFSKDGKSRKKLIVNVGRDNYSIVHHTRVCVCCGHSQFVDVNDPAKGERTRENETEAWRLSWCCSCVVPLEHLLTWREKAWSAGMKRQTGVNG